MPSPAAALVGERLGAEVSSALSPSSMSSSAAALVGQSLLADAASALSNPDLAISRSTSIPKSDQISDSISIYIAQERSGTDFDSDLISKTDDDSEFSSTTQSETENEDSPVHAVKEESPDNVVHAPTVESPDNEFVLVPLDFPARDANYYATFTESFLTEKKRLLTKRNICLKVEVPISIHHTELEPYFDRLVKGSRILHLTEMELYFVEDDHHGPFGTRNELESLNVVLSSLDQLILNAEACCKEVLHQLRLRVLTEIDKFVAEKVECRYMDNYIFEGIDADGQKLLEWGTSHNIKAKLKIFGGSNAGKGAVASEDIKTGDIILEVPDSLILSEDNVKKSDMHEYLLRVKGVTSDEMLMLWCMREKHISSSKFYAYFQSLPKKFNTGLTFREDAFCELRSTGMTDVLQRTKEKLSRRFEELVFSLKDSPNIFPSEYKFEDFLWARQLLDTHGMQVCLSDGVQKLCLVPIAGFLNHSPCPHILHRSWTFDDGFLKFRASRPCKEGEQCYISYGDHSSSTLLSYYGFVLEGFNPNDLVFFDFEDIFDVDLSEISDWSYDFMRARCFSESRGDGLPQRFLSNLYAALNLKDDDKSEATLKAKMDAVARIYRKIYAKLPMYDYDMDFNGCSMKRSVHSGTMYLQNVGWDLSLAVEYKRKWSSVLISCKRDCETTFERLETELRKACTETAG